MHVAASYQGFNGSHYSVWRLSRLPKDSLCVLSVCKRVYVCVEELEMVAETGWRSTKVNGSNSCMRIRIKWDSRSSANIFQCTRKHTHQRSSKKYGDVVCHECNEAADPHQHICHDGGVQMPQSLLPRDRVTLLYNPACKHTLKSTHLGQGNSS